MQPSSNNGLGERAPGRNQCCCASVSGHGYTINMYHPQQGSGSSGQANIAHHHHHPTNAVFDRASYRTGSQIVLFQENVTNIYLGPVTNYLSAGHQPMVSPVVAPAPPAHSAHPSDGMTTPRSRIFASPESPDVLPESPMPSVAGGSSNTRRTLAGATVRSSRSHTGWTYPPPSSSGGTTGSATQFNPSMMTTQRPGDEQNPGVDDDEDYRFTEALDQF